MCCFNPAKKAPYRCQVVSLQNKLNIKPLCVKLM